MKSAWLVAAMLFLASGCLDATSGEGATIESHVNPEAICLAKHPSCVAIDDAWIISDLEIINIHGGANGIELTGLSKPLVLRNISVTGFPVGILLPPGCSPCSLTLKNVTLEGGPNGSTGIDYRAAPTTESSINFQAVGLSIHDFDRGLGWFGHDGDSVHLQDVQIACRLEGTVISAGTIGLQDAAIEGCDGSGARLKSYTSASIEGSLFTLNGQGATLFGQSDAGAVVRDSWFEENGVGGLATGTAGIRVQGNSFVRNGGATSLPETAIEASRVHALYVNAESIEVVDNCFEQNVGWAVTSALEVAPVTIAGNRWVGTVGPVPGLTSGDDLDHPRPVPGMDEEFLDAGITVDAPLLVTTCGEYGRLDVRNGPAATQAPAQPLSNRPTTHSIG